MKNKYIAAFEAAQIEGKEIPQFRAGDTLRLGVEIKEGAKTRVQNFEGLVIALRGHGTARTFTIRKIGANNVGVERIFPLFSDSLKSIEVLRRGRVRRAKKTTFVVKNQAFRVAKPKPSSAFLREIGWCYSTSANLSSHTFDLDFAYSGADVIIENQDGLSEKKASAIYKINSIY